jgi:uncharacterized protein (TIGR03083 family)
VADETTVPVDAKRVPRLGHLEAVIAARVELDRFLIQLDRLAPDDWDKPTACTLWNVHDVVAHVAGAAASYARRSEFARQWNPLVQRAHRRPGFTVLDALNQVQVDDRATATADELLAELRHVGPLAIEHRRRIPSLLRAVRLPMPALGVAPIGYLTDLIYTRDMWIHRLDVARATDREMVTDSTHDGRIVALMVRDLGRRLPVRFRSRAIVLELDGRAGGVYRLGEGESPAATVALDALDFAWRAAGRLTADEARARAAVGGHEGVARDALDIMTVPV